VIFIEEGWLLPLSVHKSTVMAADRGTGVGRRLMAAAERWVRDCGAAEVWLDVREFNDAAIGSYKAIGYETVSRRMRRKLTG
jgi:ribosomal protein S18 acetylase RimI-like enzyme